MLATGVGLIVAGLYWLFLTSFRARSEHDVERALEIEEGRKKTFGIFSNWANQGLWAYRATYRHPVLMRLPWIVLLPAGAILVAVDLV
jgi:hypothetical protein